MTKESELLHKNILTMTGEDLLNLLRLVNSETHKEEAKMNFNNNSKVLQLVTGVKSLSAALGISVSSVNRMLADGVIDTATYQHGKILIFDVNGVLDILRRDKNK